MKNVKNDAICHVTRQNQYNPAGGGATTIYRRKAQNMHDLMVLPVTVFSQVYCLFSPPEYRRPARSVNTLAGVLRVKEESSNLKLLLNILPISTHRVYDTRIQENKVKLHLISFHMPEQYLGNR